MEPAGNPDAGVKSPPTYISVPNTAIERTVLLGPVTPSPFHVWLKNVPIVYDKPVEPVTPPLCFVKTAVLGILLVSIPAPVGP